MQINVVVVVLCMLTAYLRLLIQSVCSRVLQQEKTGPPQCGVCGDPVDMPKDHELGGKYGSGMITRYYPAGVKGEITSDILTSEQGTRLTLEECVHTMFAFVLDTSVLNKEGQKSSTHGVKALTSQACPCRAIIYKSEI